MMIVLGDVTNSGHNITLKSFSKKKKKNITIKWTLLQLFVNCRNLCVAILLCHCNRRRPSD